MGSDIILTALRFRACIHEGAYVCQLVCVSVHACKCIFALLYMYVSVNVSVSVVVVFVYVFVCVIVYVYVFVSLCVLICVCVNACMCVWMCARAFVCVCARACVCECLRAGMFAFVFLYVYFMCIIQNFFVSMDQLPLFIERRFSLSCFCMTRKTRKKDDLHSNTVLACRPTVYEHCIIQDLRPLGSEVTRYPCVGKYSRPARDNDVSDPSVIVLQFCISFVCPILE